MKKEHVIGVDVSKLTLDLVFHHNGRHLVIDNKTKGFRAFLRQVQEDGIDKQNCLVVMEHTGLYSAPFERYLAQQGIPYSKVSGLEIKLTQGIVRAKNDKIDARKIAAYGDLHQKKIAIAIPSARLDLLKKLLNLRERLVAEKAGYQTSLKEEKTFLNLPSSSRLFKTQEKLIAVLEKEILQMEKEIEAVLNEDENIEKNYKLIRSVVGVGLVMASFMIAYTDNFNKFKSARKFASYSGVAPFPFQSGISIRGKTKVNPLANKRAKTLLDLCAKSSIVHDQELRAFYLRKVESGKEKMKVINAVRNKILSRIFAVVKRGTPFEKNYQLAS